MNGVILVLKAMDGVLVYLKGIMGRDGLVLKG
jgi:hypothetical protein